MLNAAEEPQCRPTAAALQGGPCPTSPSLSLHCHCHRHCGAKNETRKMQCTVSHHITVSLLSFLQLSPLPNVLSEEGHRSLRSPCHLPPVHLRCNGSSFGRVCPHVGFPVYLLLSLCVCFGPLGGDVAPVVCVHAGITLGSLSLQPSLSLCGHGQLVE